MGITKISTKNGSLSKTVFSYAFSRIQPEFCQEFKQCPHYEHSYYPFERVPNAKGIKPSYFFECKLNPSPSVRDTRNCIYKEEYQTWKLLQ